MQSTNAFETGAPLILLPYRLNNGKTFRRKEKLDSNVRVVIAKVGFGVFVKKGAVKPDIDSVEAFKRAFLNARSMPCLIR
jgi:hypothetical protein